MFNSFPVEASDDVAAADDVDSFSQGYALPFGINIIVYKVTHLHRFFSTLQCLLFREQHRHTVIVSDFFVLIVWIGFSCLSRIPHYDVLALGIGTNQRTDTAGNNLLVTVKTQHTKLSERTQYLAFPLRVETFGRILNNINIIVLYNSLQLIVRLSDNNGKINKSA